MKFAKEAFLKTGDDASFEDVAKLAGVGIGTLYRHFPTRAALIKAVYRTEMKQLAAAEQAFARTMNPVEALRAWMLLFVDYLATKQISGGALYSLLTDCDPDEDSGVMVAEAMNSLALRAMTNGDIEKDIDPLDMLRALVGIATVASGPSWSKSAKRFVDILIDGSRSVKR